MKLHTFYRSSASFRVRIALALKEMDYSPQFVNLRTGEQKGEFVRKNPQAFVPLIEDGDFSLGQSLAIVEYLDEICPEPRLLPEAPKAKAIVRSMAQLIACDIHPLNNLRILRYLKRDLYVSQEAIDEWYRHWVSEGFQALEQLVERFGAGQRCFGEQITLADICLVPQMWNARSMKTDLAPFPHLLAVDRALMQLEPFQRAAPENQADTPAS